MMMKSKGEKVFDVCNVILMLILIVVFALPYLLIITTSLTDGTSYLQHGASLIIRKFSLQAYKYLFGAGSALFRSLGITVYLTRMTTGLSVLVTLLMAYPLSRPGFVGKRGFSVFIVFTMLFGGGTIPFYLLIDSLGLLNSLWAIILPLVMSAWNTILVRNFFSAIPISVEESAKMDGAGHLIILFRIYVPLSTSVIATVALFSAVNVWNNWTSTLMFIDDMHSHLYPIQFYIRKLLGNLDSISGSVGINPSELPTEAIVNAAMIIATLPIMIVYPFLQRYFINGVIIGSVKE